MFCTSRSNSILSTLGRHLGVSGNRRFCSTAKSWLLAPIAAAVLLAAPGHSQVQFNVGAGQTYTSIQKAVDNCPTAGCVINLTDSVYPLPREVWVEGKNNLTLQPSAQMKALKIRPRLYYAGTASEFLLAGTAANPTDPLRPAGWKQWPNKGTSQTGPGSASDNANPNSTSGFQGNGYLVIFKSNNITIDGIAIDGKKPTTFVNKGIWDDKYDVFFGNIGINLFESKRVVVRGTEIKNCFSSIYIQNRNVGGAFAAPNPNDLDKKFIVPYSQYGKMGDHLIERNYIHNNWYVVYDEMEWDIGSTIRYNLCDQNYNTQFSQNTDSSAESNNMTGGFLYMKDVRIVPHKIYNNTINGSSVIFGNSYFKPGVQHYFYNNLVTGWNRQGKNAAMISNDRQFLRLYKDFLYNNTFEVGDADSLYQIQNESSGSVKDAALCTTLNQTSPCYVTWDKPVRVTQGIKNQWLWNGWQVAQGGDYQGIYKGTAYAAYNAQNADFFQTGGLIQKVQGLGTAWVDISSQANFWARKIPYKSVSPKAAGFLEPQWDSSIVDITIQDTGWAAAGNLDLDGTPPDRGAISSAGLGIISPLTLKDQFIVTLDKTAKTVSFQYCLDAQGQATNLDFEMMSYYKTIALSTEAESKPTPAFPAPVQLVNIGDKPEPNSCGIFKAKLPTAPVDSFARFDLVIAGNVDGKPSKSNVGVWIWRQTQYKLDVYFTKSPTGTDTITSARVGDSVYMHVIGRRTDNNSGIPTLDVLAATPDKNMYLLPANTQVMPGDTIGKNLANGTGAFHVLFTSTGTVTIAMSGMVGTLPVPGAGAIHIRPGLPEQAIWQSPPDWMYADRSLTMDANATVMDQAPTPISLQVVDKFGNPVDTAAQVQLSSLKIEPAITNQGFSVGAAGPFTTTLFTSDATGKVSGYNMVNGVEGQKFWGFATVVGKTTIDSALMKVGKPLAQLYFVPASAIDTFISTPVKIHLILSKNGTDAEVADPLSSAVVHLRSVYGAKLFDSPTSTTPLDSIALVAGAVDLWVSSVTPVTKDSIFAVNPWIGNGVAAVFAPVTFRMPPKPPTPTLKSAVFLDGDCNGIADSVLITFDPNGAVAVLKPADVRINRIKLALPGGDSLILDSTAVRTLAGGASVAIALPASAQAKFAAYNPSSQIQLWAALVRPPAADTTVAMGGVAVTDGIGPRPIAATLVENPDPATIADTLTVVFSEPIKFTGTQWPFRTFTAGMTEIPAPEIVVVSGNQETPSSIKFVLSGNTLGHLVAGTILAIQPASGLTDVAGNDSRFATCGTDTTLVILKPTVVQVNSAAILDKNGDGIADHIHVVFRRDFLKASERPDKLIVSDWDGIASVAFDFTQADSLSPQTYDLALTSDFPLGATVGKGANGSGTLTVVRGTLSVGNPGQVVALTDSVPPIAVGSAKLKFGTAYDTIVVTYSEPMLKGVGGVSTMVLKGTDLSLVFTNGIPDASKRIWTFDVERGKLQVGDSIRLPPGVQSQYKAVNGALPSDQGNAPYVPVVGGDRAPDSAFVLDLDGDGTGDAVRLFYSKAPIGNPSFAFSWAGKDVAADSVSYKGIVAGKTDVTIPVAGFASLTTTGSGSANSISYVGGSAFAPLGFPLKDGIAPVLLSAYVSYGMDEGVPDTVILKLSEAAASVVTSNGKQILAKHLGAVLPFQANDPSTAQTVHSAGSNEFRLICSSDNCNLPGYGDFVRLEKGSVTDLANAVVGDSSRWVPVTTGPKPIRYRAAIYPKPVLENSGKASSPLNVLGALSAWVRPEGGAMWVAHGGTAQKWTQNGGTIDDVTVDNGLVGVKLDLNSSFEGQFIVYDNIGTFVGSTEVKLDLEALQLQGLTNGANKYSVLVSLNGLDASGAELASGVYMIRVIGYTEQTVNGQPVRLMVQNKIFTVGCHNKFK